MPRSVAFSGKKKKAQLRDRREKKGDGSSFGKGPMKGPPSHFRKSSQEELLPEPYETLPDKKSGLNRHERFKLLFQQESREEVQEARLHSQNEVVFFDNSKLDIGRQFSDQPVIEFPRRPDWNGESDPKRIDEIENREFEAYLEKIHSEHDKRQLSFFEHNIETWRQIWRLIEFADIVAIVADVRHPILHFPPSLYFYIQELKKKCILILSKVDLVKPELYIAWKKYFTSKYPDLQVIGFTCFDRFGYQENRNIQQKRNRTVKFGNQFGSIFGPVDLGDAVSTLYPNHDLEEWLERLKEQNKVSAESVTADPIGEVDDNAIKIGFIGHTNVGKSSIMNTLVGEKHFSMSIRPGHTKILQTWNVAKNVQLVDSPGIIFPSYYPKELQVLSGLFPIDQARKPFTAVGYLAERVDLVRMFQLRHVSDEDEFTPWDICESFAKKKNFMVARKKYPDASRGANMLLRMAVTGQIVMAFVPPGFKPEMWENEPEVKKMKSNYEKEFHSRRVAENFREEIHSSSMKESSDNDDDDNDDDDDFGTTQNRFAFLDE